MKNDATEKAAIDDDWGAALDEQADSEKSSATQKVNTDNIFKDLSGQSVKNESNQDIEFILDIPVLLTVELGRTKIIIKNLLQLTQGSVIELNGMAGEPMDVLVNGCLIAQGEVVVVNEKFGIRLTDITSPAERIKKLNR
jgi:flagellar motor switch protein FliN/FliY